MANTTMFRLRRILIHVDTTSDRWPALTRGLRLAKQSGGAIRLVDVLAPEPWHTPKGRDLQRLLKTTMKKRLTDAAARAKRAGVRCTVAMLEGDVTEEMVRHSLKWRADLVLRSHGVSRATPRPIGPTDSQLLRRCPSAIWFVTPRQADGETVVVAAVSPDPDDRERQDLAVRVAQAAIAVSTATGASLQLVHGWTAYGHQVLASHTSAADLVQYVEACRERARARIDALIRDAHIPDSVHVHLVQGESDQVLSAFIKRRRASLVVIGTVGRTGLAGLVVGNTAERILRSVRCSVLALKPAGFADAMLESRRE